MMVKASMQVICQLSDAQESVNFARPENVASLLNFAKYIIMKCEGDLTKEIDADEMYAEYQKRFEK